MASSAQAKVIDPQTYPDKARAIQAQLLQQYPFISTSKPGDADYQRALTLNTAGNLLVDMATKLAACDAELQRLKNPTAQTATS